MRSGYQAKLYKTSDFVRYMDDGSILFCGHKNNHIIPTVHMPLHDMMLN